MYNQLFIRGSFGLTWFVIIAAALFFFKRLLSRENIYLLISICLFYGMVMFIYLFTQDAYGWLDVTFNRVLLSIYPVAVYTLGCIVPKLKAGKLGDL
jgi:hypothetical protein